MRKANLVALLHACSGAAALIAALYAGTDFLASVRLIRPLGFALFVGGMLLFAITVAYLRRGFLGDVEPVSAGLVTAGPYRFVRHPLYLGMILATLGLAVAFRSPWAMMIILAVFIPSGLYRAKLEEEALAQKFGQEWENYARRTRFILPLVY